MASFIPSIQAKLQVDPATSPHEIEADRMADFVVNPTSGQSTVSFIAPSPIQRTPASTVPLRPETNPDQLIDEALPRIPGEENIEDSGEAEINPEEEKKDELIEDPKEAIEKPKEKESEGGKEEAAPALVGEEEIKEDGENDEVSAEDSAAFQGEPSLEPTAPIEITPALSDSIQTKKEESQSEEEGEKEQIDEEPIKRHAFSSGDGESTVHRMSSGVTPEPSAKLESRLSATKGGGQPLGRAERSQMEGQFGADFSSVRIHSGGEAAGLSSQLSARAFTHGSDIYFNEGQYEPHGGEGKHLLAHELTHVVQQGKAVQRKPQISSAPVKVQRLGIGDALDYFADKAHHIPGYRMFTIILGVNPINMSSVDRSASNIMRAMVEFLPGGKLITDALDNHGIFDKASSWFKQQLDSLSITGSSIKNAVDEFLDSLSWTDIVRLGSVWNRAKRIFTAPIDRLIAFATGLVTTIMDMVKDAILRPLAMLAEGTSAYDLLRVALGEDPITGDPYPPTADNLIGGFMKLIGQEEIWENIKKGNAIERAFAWFKGAMQGLMTFVTSIPGTIISTITSLSWTDIVLVPMAFAKVGKAFLNVASQFMEWAGGTVLQLLEILFSVVAPGAVPWIKKAGAAFSSILENPIGFVGNLITAAKNGFLKFAQNIAKHLKKALINWLMGSLAGAGVHIPQSLSIKEIIKFVLSVLGVTWTKVRVKLVKHLGETAVKALETGFELVTLLVTKGPMAMWERIKTMLSDLKSMVIGEISSWVVVQVVKKAITKLVTSLNPAGAVIQAILAIYDTITFLIDKISQIAKVGFAILNSIVSIANGVIAAAIQKVEQTLAGILSLAISFLAKFAGLGKISTKIISIVKKVQAKVDAAIDSVIGWIVSKAKAFLGKIIKKDDDQNHAQYAAEVVGELSGPSTKKDYKGARAEKETKASALEQKYSGKLKKGIKMKVNFTEAKADEQDQDIDFKVVIAPNTTTMAGTGSYIAYTQADVPAITIEFKFNPKAQYAKEPGAREEYQRQIDMMRTELSKLGVGDWLANRESFLEIQAIKRKVNKKKTLESDEKSKLDAFNAADRKAREDARAVVMQEIIDELIRDEGFDPSTASAEFRRDMEPLARKIYGKEGHNRAALHLDKVAGGSADEIIGLGDSKVNSAIGSTLSNRFRYKKVQGEAELKDFIGKLSDEQKSKLTMEPTFTLT